MEIKENDTLFLMTLATFGAVLASGLAVLLQWIIVLPLTLAVLILMILTYLLYKKKSNTLIRKWRKLGDDINPFSFHSILYLPLSSDLMVI